MVSTTSQYALRALLALARLPKGEPALGRQLAAREGIPHNYLAKILKELNSAGIVSATRGIGGGYRLPPTSSMCARRSAGSSYTR